MANWNQGLTDDWDSLDVNAVPELWPSLSEANATSKVQKAPSSGLFSETALRQAHPYFEAQPSVKILPRKNQQGQGPRGFQSNGPSSTPAKSLQEREKEYAEARKRILGENEASEGSKSNEEEILQPQSSPKTTNTNKTRGRGRGTLFTP